jgi:hypothetical protein
VNFQIIWKQINQKSRRITRLSPPKCSQSATRICDADRAGRHQVPQRQCFTLCAWLEDILLLEVATIIRVSHRHEFSQLAGFKGSERRRVGHGSEKAKPNSPGVGLCVKSLCPMGCTHKVGEIACLLVSPSKPAGRMVRLFVSSSSYPSGCFC